MALRGLIESARRWLHSAREPTRAEVIDREVSKLYAMAEPGEGDPIREGDLLLGVVAIYGIQGMDSLTWELPDGRTLTARGVVGGRLQFVRYSS